MLTNEYPPNVYGGAGVHVDYLTKELKKYLKVHICCFGKQNIISKDFSVKGFESVLKKVERFDVKAGKALDALSINLQMLNEFTKDVDIVHTHTWYTALGGVIAKILYGMPHVLTTHSLEPLREWKKEQLGSGYNLSSWVEKVAIQGADGIIAVSENTKSDIIRYFGVAPEKVKVIYNGVDLNEYHHVKTAQALKRYGVDEEIPYVLFVGRITRQKGIIHLVNAIEFIDRKVQIVLLAGAPDTKDIAFEMKEAVNAAKRFNKNVIWIDKMLPKNETIEFYSNARVFCCPSVYEPFGLINIESMACGTPVVATKTGGIVEVVEDGKCGFLVPIEQRAKNHEPRNPRQFSKALAEKINLLIKNDQLRERFSIYGRKLVEKKFSWEGIGRQTFEYYRSVMK